MQIELTQLYALITVYYKHSPAFDRLVRAIHKSGRLIISSGGTATYIRSLGIPVKDVSELTKFPEMMGSRVKILHPVIFGGILRRLDVLDDIRNMQQYDIPNVDIVICNPYPFAEEVAKRAGTTHKNIIEKIDIGGPSATMAAAKNYEQGVCAICDLADYGPFAAMIESGDEIPLSQRRKWAAKVFDSCSKYYADVALYFNHDNE